MTGLPVLLALRGVGSIRITEPAAATPADGASAIVAPAVHESTTSSSSSSRAAAARSCDQGKRGATKVDDTRASSAYLFGFHLGFGCQKCFHRQTRTRSALRALRAFRFGRLLGFLALVVVAIVILFLFLRTRHQA